MEAVALSISLTAHKTSANLHSLIREEVQPALLLVDSITRKPRLLKGISRLAFAPFNGQQTTDNGQIIRATIIPAFNAIETSWATTTKIYKRPPVLRFILGGIPLHKIYSILANPDTSIKLNEEVSPISTYISKSAGIRYSLEGYVLVIRFDRKEATASIIQQRRLVITATTVLKEKVVAEISVPTVKGERSKEKGERQKTIRHTPYTYHLKRRRLKRWPRKN